MIAARSSVTFDAIGTKWQIRLLQEITAQNKASLFTKVTDRIELFDKAYSRFRSDSLVTKISQSAGKYTFPDDALPLINLYQELYQLTDGIFTPLIGSVMESAGYDAQYSLQPSQMSSPPSWADVIQYSHPQLSMKRPHMLDFGAGGKGYLVDLVAEVLVTNGVTSFYIDASGDVLHQDETDLEITVGLEHPGNPREVIGVARLSNQAICGSAGNRRTWDIYHHIINPKTLTSPQEILAVWVIANSTLLSDVLSTALFFVSPELLLSRYTFKYLLINQDYSITKSDDFPAELYTSGS
ncbi:MAG: FAD:protein FMN transferase [bacterium]|nr:FAD:protein FMN transferase [bacterium]